MVGVDSGRRARSPSPWALLSELQVLRWVLGYLLDGPQGPMPCYPDRQDTQGTQDKEHSTES